ncbi:DUF6286 domain-containing protein, partial [Actinocorallia lasiicapitis]
ATATVRRRRVVVRVRTRLRNPGNLGDLVQAAVEARLTGLNPARRRYVAVRVDWRR